MSELAGSKNSDFEQARAHLREVGDFRVNGCYGQNSYTIIIGDKWFGVSTKEIEYLRKIREEMGGCPNTGTQKDSDSTTGSNQPCCDICKAGYVLDKEDGNFYHL